MDAIVVPVRLPVGQDRSYEVRIGKGLLARAGEIARDLGLGRRALVVADAGVGALADRARASLEAAGIEARIEVVPAGEASKSLSRLERLWDALAAFDGGVRPGVVAVGGGVVSDLAGFAAATYRRGVPWIACPTTLLAMVDASVGGKTGIDRPRGKNLVGAFHQPRAVLADLEALATLPDVEYRCGLAEVVKHGILGDADLFEAVEGDVAGVLARRPAAVETMTARSVRLKAAIVAEDEHDETGRRALLNLGHTFAHALETAAGYAGRHGEAVAVGLVAAARLAAALGRLGAADRDRIERLVATLGLPTRAAFDAEAALGAMRADKKATEGRLRFVLPVRIGEARLFDDVPGEVVRAVLETVRA